jgi:hypothetical protein
MIFYKEGFELVPDLQFIKAIPEFAEIISSDRGGSIGDADGRRKKFALAVLNYVFYCCEFTQRNPFWNLPIKDRHEPAMKLAGLEPETYDKVKKVSGKITFIDNWITKVEEAKTAFMKIQGFITPSIETQINLQEGIRISNEIVTILNANLKKQLDTTSKMEEVPVAKINEILGNINTLLVTQSSIKKAQKDSDDLIELIQKERIETALAKGGKIIGSRADPNNMKGKRK